MSIMSTTTRLVVVASRVIHDMVVVLSEPEQGSAMLALGTSTIRVVLWRTREVNSRYELVIAPPGLVSNTKELVVLDSRF